MSEIIWIQERAVRAFHSRQIAEHGGSAGVRDEGLLASALARPQNLEAYGTDVDLASLATAYAYGLAKNHAFIDGNKRTAWVTMRAFLVANGATFDAPQNERYEKMLGLADGNCSEEEFANWIRENLS